MGHVIPASVNRPRTPPPKLYVENWSPAYGSPVGPSGDLDDATTEQVVDVTVETGGSWDPIAPEPATSDSLPDLLAFVDGVRRVEAWLTLDDLGSGPLPGMLAAFGVGASVWNRRERRSEFDRDPTVERLLVMAGGRAVRLLHPIKTPVTTKAVPGNDRADLLAYLQNRMRTAEQNFALRLASRGNLVIADGTLHGTQARNVVGYTKTHKVRYLTSPEQSSVIARLEVGQRTPLFLIGRDSFSRYAWYLRLADLPHAHSWTGVVRCEAPTAPGLAAAAQMADWTTMLLPLLAPPPFTDPRAPQNLIPIAALERHLRQLLGDARLAKRSLRTAVVDAAWEDRSLVLSAASKT